jgi:hypothetical protein
MIALRLLAGGACDDLLASGLRAGIGGRCERRNDGNAYRTRVWWADPMPVSIVDNRK